MLIKLITILACGLSAVALYIMMAILTTLSMENDLPHSARYDRVKHIKELW